jgi:hypothetical protein
MMKQKLISGLLILSSCLVMAQKENRGLFAFINGNKVQVSWRMRATDNPTQMQYEVYADNKKVATLRSKTTLQLSKAAYGDATFSLVVKDEDGNIVDQQSEVAVQPNPYLDIPLSAPTPVTYNDSTIITYTPGDCSAYDMDGDGNQEIILKWMPSNIYDRSLNLPAHEYLDCYKLDGTRLWRLDMGQNMGAGNNFTFMCWDFDGDGKGELICKTAPGSKDATGAYVGKGLAGYPDDLQKLYYRGSDGWPTRGQEWITCYDGATGKELASRLYWPYFSIQTDWDPRSGSTDGEAYGRRGNGFKGVVMKIPCRDGQLRPVCVMQRGIYSYVYATAISWDGKNLTEEWRHASTGENTSVTTNATGTHTQTISLFAQGAHAGQAADLDGDGYDELCIGAAAIDHDGTVLWSTGLGHGDMISVGELNPHNEGLETWRITEGATAYDACMISGKDGKVLNGQPYTSGDVGRGLVMDLDSTVVGSEYFFMTSGKIYDCDGNALYDLNRGNATGYPNYRIFWDGDLTDKHFDGEGIAKYDIKNHYWTRCVRNLGDMSLLWKLYGVLSINSTKQNPCLQCDLFGDFREEIAMYTTAQTAGRSDCDYVLRVLTTTYDTDKKLPWLRDDNTYNLQIASQNVGYSQSPHLGYNAYAYYQSLGQMGKDEITEETAGSFNPVHGAYYTMGCSDGYLGFANGQVSKGMISWTTTPYEVQFIKCKGDNTYLIKGSDGYYLHDSGNYGFKPTTDSTQATPYQAKMDGELVYFASMAATNSNVYVCYNSSRKAFLRGAGEDNAARFTIVPTGKNDPTSIALPSKDGAKIKRIYSIDGRPGAKQGVKIIQYQDGTVKKRLQQDR